MIRIVTLVFSITLIAGFRPAMAQATRQLVPRVRRRRLAIRTRPVMSPRRNYRMA